MDQRVSGIPLYDHYFVGNAKAHWYALGAVAKAENVLQLCKDLKPSRIADIGAGNGEVTARLRDARLGSTYYAFEISESGLAAIRSRFDDDAVKCMKFDGYHIPADDNAFDLAVLSHVVEHVEHPRKLLYETRRVSRYACVEVPLEHRSLRATLGTAWQPDKTGHINFFDLATARWLLETSGWKVLRFLVCNPPRAVLQFSKGRTKGFFQWAIREALLRLSPRLAQKLFCYHACFLCERGPTVAELLM
jgi:SAM-dependent methyltransferase